MTSLDIEFIINQVEQAERAYNQERGTEVDYYLADLRNSNQ